MEFINKSVFELEQFKITPQEFLVKRKEPTKPVILDIRTLEAASQHTFMESYSLPAEMIEENLIQLPPFGVIILYSDWDNTDIEESIKMLWDNGFNEIFYVDGGYQAMMQAIISISDSALAKIPAYIEKNKRHQEKALKISIIGYDYEINLLEKDEDINNLKAIEYADFDIYFDPKVFRLLEKAQIDFADDQPTIYHPRVDEPRPEGSIRERVQQLIDDQINPSVAMHGGVITLLDVAPNTVYIEMGGGCQGCGMSKVTLKNGIEAVIMENVPEITEILDITDHASGENPYYREEV